MFQEISFSHIHTIPNTTGLGIILPTPALKDFALEIETTGLTFQETLPPPNEPFAIGIILQVYFIIPSSSNGYKFSLLHFIEYQAASGIMPEGSKYTMKIESFSSNNFNNLIVKETKNVPIISNNRMMDTNAVFSKQASNLSVEYKIIDNGNIVIQDNVSTSDNQYINATGFIGLSVGPTLIKKLKVVINKE